MRRNVYLENRMWCIMIYSIYKHMSVSSMRLCKWRAWCGCDRPFSSTFRCLFQQRFICYCWQCYERVENCMRKVQWIFFILRFLLVLCGEFHSCIPMWARKSCLWQYDRSIIFYCLLSNNVLSRILWKECMHHRLCQSSIFCDEFNWK